MSATGPRLGAPALSPLGKDGERVAVVPFVLGASRRLFAAVRRTAKVALQSFKLAYLAK